LTLFKEAVLTLFCFFASPHPRFTQPQPKFNIVTRAHLPAPPPFCLLRQHTHATPPHGPSLLLFLTLLFNLLSRNSHEAH